MFSQLGFVCHFIFQVTKLFAFFAATALREWVYFSANGKQWLCWEDGVVIMMLAVSLSHYCVAECWGWQLRASPLHLPQLGRHKDLVQLFLGVLQLMAACLSWQLFFFFWSPAAYRVSVAKCCVVSLSNRKEPFWCSCLAGTTSAVLMTCSWLSRCSDQVHT